MKQIGWGISELLRGTRESDTDELIEIGENITEEDDMVVVLGTGNGSAKLVAMAGEKPWRKEWTAARWLPRRRKFLVVGGEESLRWDRVAVEK